MSLWCERLEADGGRTQVIEAFWHDPSSRFSIRCHEEELPFGLVRAFIKVAAEACPPTKSKEIGAKMLIYVRLLEENVDVWRPVTAELVDNNDCTYRIIGVQPETERWEFGPDTVVRCEERRFPDQATVGLVAIKRAG
jgi:hypothetical protein